MSYDVHLEIDTGGPDPAEVCDVGNYTSNCSCMWDHAMGEPHLRDLDGAVAGEHAERIIAAARRMEDDPATYAAMNPPNGWGDSVTAQAYLLKIGKACRAHPKAVLRVWC